MLQIRKHIRIKDSEKIVLHLPTIECLCVCIYIYIWLPSILMIYKMKTVSTTSLWVKNYNDPVLLPILNIYRLIISPSTKSSRDRQCLLIPRQVSIRALLIQGNSCSFVEISLMTINVYVMPFCSENVQPEWQLSFNGIWEPHYWCVKLLMSCKA